MKNNFEIFNFGLYPNINFSEDLLISQDVIFVGREISEKSATTKYYSSTIDTAKSKRAIQSIIIEKYIVELIVAKNIDLSLLEVADVVILTPKIGDKFNINNVKIVTENIAGTENFKITLEFNKIIDDDIIYHLSSDIAEKHVITGIQNVNELNFTVNKPAITYFTDIYLDGGYSHFKFPLSQLTEHIAVNDWFYLHVDNDNFDSDFSACFCDSIDSNFVYFAIIDAYTKTFAKTRIIIDFEPESYTVSTVDNNNLELNFSIYSFLFANTNFVNENESKLELRNGIKDFSSNNNYLVAEFRFWLKTSELWKMKYLAIADECILKQKNKDDIVPNYIPEIKQIEKETLIELHEFVIEIPYDLLNVNLHR